ncbi:MAG: shikimate kinase AroK [Sedimenticola sp.]|jgi:shikimate kinase|nr:MAG: shikimate kinase AroK [Sedimenticola sp.]
MKQASKIFLIGPMGVGKSTIGKQLAALLNYNFQDTDWEIQRRTGVDIRTIFDYEGEEGFRKREKTVVDDLSQSDQLVLATGGGVVLDQDNRKALTSRGVVVYLHCSPEQQFERTLKDKKRPLLQIENPLERLISLMSEREPFYREMADLVVSTERRSALTVAKEIARRLRQE